MCRVTERKFGKENYCIVLGTTAQGIGKIPERLNDMFKRIVEREDFSRNYRVHVKAFTQIKEWENTEKGMLQVAGHTIAVKEGEKKGNDSMRRIAKMIAGAIKNRKGETKKKKRITKMTDKQIDKAMRMSVINCQNAEARKNEG